MTTAGLMFINGEKEKENVAEEKLRKLQEEVLKAESDRVAKQSQAELIKSASPDSLPEMLDDKALADNQARAYGPAPADGRPECLADAGPS